MSESSFDLLFRGELLPDHNLADVRANLGRTLKLDPPKLDQLFSGQLVYLRRQADRETAARFQAAFRAAGARLRVVPAGAELDPNQSPAPMNAAAASPQRSMPDPTPAALGRKKPSLAERLAAASAEAVQSAGAPAPPPSAPSSIAGEVAAGRAARRATPWTANSSSKNRGPLPGFGAPAGLAAGEFEVAPVGADVLRPEERVVIVPRNVRTDHISLAEPGGRLTEPEMNMELLLNLDHLSLAEPGARIGEERVEPVPSVPDPRLDLAPPGANLGVRPERADGALLGEGKQRQISTDHLSVAPLGSRLGGNDRPPPPPAPDTTHIKLE